MPEDLSKQMWRFAAQWQITKLSLTVSLWQTPLPANVKINCTVTDHIVTTWLWWQTNSPSKNVKINCSVANHIVNTWLWQTTSPSKNVRNNCSVENHIVTTRVWQTTSLSKCELLSGKSHSYHVTMTDDFSMQMWRFAQWQITYELRDYDRRPLQARD